VYDRLNVTFFHPNLLLDKTSVKMEGKTNLSRRLKQYGGLT